MNCQQESPRIAVTSDHQDHQDRSPQLRTWNPRISLAEVERASGQAPQDPPSQMTGFLGCCLLLEFLLNLYRCLMLIGSLGICTHKVMRMSLIVKALLRMCRNHKTEAGSRHNMFSGQLFLAAWHVTLNLPSCQVATELEGRGDDVIRMIKAFYDQAFTAHEKKYIELTRFLELTREKQKRRTE